MRFRPFGRSGAAVSALSLTLTDAPLGADDRIRLIYAALEAGINTFELHSREPSAAEVLGQALSVVERNMVVVSIRLGWRREGDKRVRDLTPDGLTGAIQAAVGRSGLRRMDVAILDLVEGENLPEHVMPMLRAARADGLVAMLGVAGAAAADPWIDDPNIDVLATPYNLHSGWGERNRLARAARANMAILGVDYMPFGRRKEERPVAPSEVQPARGLSRLFSGGPKAPGPDPIRPAGGPYDFLERTEGWTPEEICLAFALNEPSLATVEVRPRDGNILAGLAAVAEREMPTGIPAQIEMARFSAGPASGAA
jgi:aryl-alcohol dehydrogenase-like predicted oxidoreductase